MMLKREEERDSVWEAEMQRVEKEVEERRERMRWMDLTVCLFFCSLS
jgi:hypothetical protein